MSFIVEILIEVLGGAVAESMSETRSKSVRRRFEIVVAVLGVVSLGACICLGLWVGGGAGVVVAVCAGIASILVLAVLYDNFLQLMPEVSPDSENRL